MADEEAQNQEQNAEATEAVEAGAEAVEEAPIQEPKAPSVLVPMLLSAVITVAGVGVMVAVILPKQISKAIAAASDTNGTQGQVQKDGEGGSEDSKGDAEDSKSDDEETADPTAEADDPSKPVPIVPEGESIVVNPANSAGTRYLLVEIFLIRKDEEDTGFSKAVESKTKQLQAETMDILSQKDVKSLSVPYTKDVIKNDLKDRYQLLIGKNHPIKELIVSKWIMQ
ncbi:MAG: flagellar basal body-associated FliL family protein [Limisphaerales bacterium]|nr:MAG: flagellar basal body-associated FliL family protein [Limisphaerales bacterium]